MSRPSQNAAIAARDLAAVWHPCTQPTHRFVTLTNSYHGAALGTLAVADVELHKKVYRPLLMDVITGPSPDCHRREPGESPGAYSRRLFAPMEEARARHGRSRGSHRRAARMILAIETMKDRARGAVDAACA